MSDEYMERIREQRLKEKKDSEHSAQLIAAMSPEMAELHTHIYILRGGYRSGLPSLDELERGLYVTPFEGAYGRAGYVVTLNGSPPRFVAVVISSECAPDRNEVHVLAPRMFVIGEDRPIKWQGLRKAVLRYIELWKTIGQ